VVCSTNLENSGKADHLDVAYVDICSKSGCIRTKTVVRATTITVTDTIVRNRRRSRSPSRTEAATDPISRRLRDLLIDVRSGGTLDS
jgi:hypothetical protein